MPYVKSLSSHSDSDSSSSSSSKSGKYAAALSKGSPYKPKVAPPAATPAPYASSLVGAVAPSENKKSSAYASSMSSKPFKGIY